MLIKNIYSIKTDNNIQWYIPIKGAKTDNKILETVELEHTYVMMNGRSNYIDFFLLTTSERDFTQIKKNHSFW